MQKAKEKHYALLLLDMINGVKEQEISEPIQRFVDFLQKQGALQKSKKIFQEFIHLYDKKFGVSTAKVETAEPMTVELLEKLFSSAGHKVTVDTQHNPSLLAGMKIRLNNEIIIDASLRGRLEELKEQIAKE